MIYIYPINHIGLDEISSLKSIQSDIELFTIQRHYAFGEVRNACRQIEG